MLHEAEHQRNFLEAYSARRTDQSMRILAADLEIPDRELREWLRDPAFRDRLRDIDLGRAEMVREIAIRNLTAAVENLAALACSGRRAAPRATETLAKLAGLLVVGPQVVVNSTTQAQVNTHDLAQVLRDMREVDALLAEHGVVADAPTDGE